MSEPPGQGPGKGPTLHRCPICGKPAQDDFKPFCSRRCADVDLGRWLNERYVVPGEEPSEEEQDG